MCIQSSKTSTQSRPPLVFKRTNRFARNQHKKKVSPLSVVEKVDQKSSLDMSTKSAPVPQRNIFVSPDGPKPIQKGVAFNQGPPPRQPMNRNAPVFVPQPQLYPRTGFNPQFYQQPQYSQFYPQPQNYGPPRGYHQPPPQFYQQPQPQFYSQSPQNYGPPLAPRGDQNFEPFTTPLNDPSSQFYPQPAQNYYGPPRGYHQPQPQNFETFTTPLNCGPPPAPKGDQNFEPPLNEQLPQFYSQPQPQFYPQAEPFRTFSNHPTYKRAPNPYLPQNLYY